MMGANHTPPVVQENNIEMDDEDTLVTARFDEAALRQAKPAIAVPPNASQKRRGRWLMAVALMVGLSAGVLGSLLVLRYVPKSAEPRYTVAKSQSASTSHEEGAVNQKTPAAKPADNTNAASVITEPADQPVEEDEEAAEEEPAKATASTPDAEDARAQQQELRRAFQNWLAANQDGNVERQMDYYHSKVNAFYLRRGVSTEAVRAEKSRVLNRANAIHIEAGEPHILITPDGQQAVIRYRKRYRIENDEGERSGEVLQELRWQRINDKWRIVSERDIKVLQ